VFPKPAIKRLLDQYVIVQLYTDRLPPWVRKPATTEAENKALLFDDFKSEQLPLYVILKPNPSAPNGYDQIAIYKEGKINNEDAFADFLRKPLESNRAETDLSMK
jgi:hypothetical protein